MALIGRDPFDDLLSLQERINSLFEEGTARSEEVPSDAVVGFWSPAVDILEMEDQIILKAELPGVALEEVELEIKDDLLILRGERHFSKETKGEKYHRIERAYGSFSRSFRLPNSIDQSKIQANLRDGILQVILPMVPQT